MLFPQKKSNDLIDLINSMIATGSNELTIARVRREAGKLLSAQETTEANQVLGMLAAFQGDYDEVDRAFRCAIAASGNDHLVTLNYAVALSNLRRHRKAVEVARSVEKRVQDDVEVLAQALGIHADACDVDGARSLISRLARLKHLGKQTAMIESRITPQSAIFDRNGVSWEDMAARMELVSDVLHSCGFPPMSYAIRQEIGDDAVLNEYLLDTDAAGAAAAEDAITRAIANQPYSRVDNVVVSYCLPA